MPTTTRRSFLHASAAMLAGAVAMDQTRGQDVIAGFDQTRTDYDRTQIRKFALPPGVSPGGHGGSHGYLSDDFIDAILREHKPAVDVIDALNMTVPGYYAHISATKDGETVKIPQYAL